MREKYSLLFLLCLINTVILKAQLDSNKSNIQPFLKLGATFLKYELLPGDAEVRNRWCIEVGAYSKRKKLSLSLRYFTQPYFIKNYLMKRYSPKYVTQQDRLLHTQKGDVIAKFLQLENLSLIFSKDFHEINTKSKISGGVGLMLRRGEIWYFEAWREPTTTFEPYVNRVKMDPLGLLTRVEYTYTPRKHLTLSANIEYTRFIRRVRNIFGVSFSVGTYF